MATETPPHEITKSNLDQWFDQIVASIEVDRLTVLTGTAPSEKMQLYTDLVDGNMNAVAGNMRAAAAQHFILEIVQAYIKELVSRDAFPKKLALDISDSKILAWAEINDDDETLEDQLILAEAKVNSLFSEFSFYLSTTIVEKGDGIPIPPHYRIVNK